MQQQNERSVSAQVPVDEGEGQLHEHGRYEREEERESLPDLVPGGAVRGAEVQRCRGLGREQRHRHKDGTGESHSHSLRHLGNATRCFVHNDTTEPSVRRPLEGTAAVAAAAAAHPRFEAGRQAGRFHGQVLSRGESVGGALQCALTDAPVRVKKTP